jgi:hypothetical protein
MAPAATHPVLALWLRSCVWWADCLCFEQEPPCVGGRPTRGWWRTAWGRQSGVDLSSDVRLATTVTDQLVEEFLYVLILSCPSVVAAQILCQALAWPFVFLLYAPYRDRFSRPCACYLETMYCVLRNSCTPGWNLLPAFTNLLLPVLPCLCCFSLVSVVVPM